MTLDDKIQMVSGIGLFSPSNPNPGSAGAITANARLCIPALVMNDAGAGVGDTQALTTAFANGVSQASAWDPALVKEYGQVLADEALAKGVNVMLAPAVNVLRNPLDGRGFEYAGEDPYLAGQTGAALIRGIQSRPVLATVKHYAANDQETNRNTDSSDVDERTLQEIYLPAFDDAVKAGAASVMCSYNLVNGVHACQNKTLLTSILKGQFGFGGFVMSDWFATHSTVPEASAGMDMEMPGSGALGVDGAGGTQYYGARLKTAVEQGQVPVARLDDMVRRIVLMMFQHGLFDHVPAEGAQAAATPATTPRSIALATSLAQRGSVLLKNSGGVLPLTGGGKRIAVIGSPADPAGATLASQGYGSSHVPQYGYKEGVVSPLQSITARAARNGDVVSYAGSTNPTAAAAVAGAADTAVVFVSDVSVEGKDRPDLTARAGTCNPLTGTASPQLACLYDNTDQDALVAAVAKANPNTVVVLQNGLPVSMPWLPAVKGVVENWYPGQVDGDAITPLLFGDVNFSGKLPVTFPKSLADSPLQTAAQYPGVPDANGVPRSTYSERLLVGYRWYQAKGVAPLFSFGFGLSYTSFRYGKLSVTPHGSGARVSFTITNTGRRAGAEIGQLYVSFPPSSGEPPYQLKGFANVSLAPGQTRTVTLNLDQSAFSLWQTGTHSWAVQPGCYRLSVGGSSDNLPLHAQLPRAGGPC